MKYNYVYCILGILCTLGNGIQSVFTHSSKTFYLQFFFLMNKKKIVNIT